MVFRCSALAVVGLIQTLLGGVEHVDLHVAGAGGLRVGDVVHEDAELTHAQVVHIRKLGHQAVHALIDGLLVGEVNGLLHGGVSHPDEVHVALGGLLGKLLHLAAGADADGGLLLGDGLRIGLVPLTQVIGVGLGAVEEDVHLVALGEVEPAQSALHAPGVAVVAFHAATVLLEGVVLKGGDLHLVVGGLLQHQVQSGQTVVGSVAVLAQNDDVAVFKHLHHMHVVPVLALGEHVLGHTLIGVGGVAGAVDAHIQVGVGLSGLVGNLGGVPVVGEDLLDAVGGDGVDALTLDDVDGVGEGDGALFIGHLLGSGVDGVVAAGHIGGVILGVVHSQLKDGHRLPVGLVVAADVHPEIAAHGGSLQGDALVLGGGVGVALKHGGPALGVVRHLQLVLHDVLLLPGDIHRIKGGGGAKINLQPLGGGACVVGIGGPAGAGVAIHSLVSGEAGTGLHIAGRGGLVQGQVGVGGSLSGLGEQSQARHTGGDHAYRQDRACDALHEFVQDYSSFVKNAPFLASVYLLFSPPTVQLW